MTNTVVLGMQWGDEGKGKIVDLICPAFDAVARYQGGHNAGHTVKFADRHFALHFLPSGILHGDARCYLGNGMVIYPEAFFEELDAITEAGIDAEGRLFISDRAQVILDLHARLDQAREAARGADKIGTTARGIGPAYETKAARVGLRIGDLSGTDLESRVEQLMDHVGPQLRGLSATAEAELPTVAELVARCRGWAERLEPFVRDTTKELNDLIDHGGSVLFEGAQGALLDLDHGTFPYVTSSSATAGGVAIGTGVAPTRLTGVLGVIKAYTTRVGAGPFVTELHDEVGSHLAKRGNEFGTSTGRPRRCGWFDAVAARYSRRLNGVDAMAVTKLDVMDELEEIQVCTGYEIDGEIRTDFPARISDLMSAKPVYETVPGWQQDTVGTLAVAELPQAARDYLALLQDLVGAPVGLISTGPRREETLVVDSEATRRILGGKLDEVIAGRGA
ncbi:MAG: adenylosuccinate synthase [Thermoanaerobaculia bacterium]|nr:adenylosuccinate synthase [Thermoanaerobaculia bacterium]